VNSAFLTEQFRLLQRRLEDAIPMAKKAFLQQLYSQVRISSTLHVALYFNLRSSSHTQQHYRSYADKRLFYVVFIVQNFAMLRYRFYLKLH